MKISDELREFADAEVLSAIEISDLKRMAKRIDREMVELPKDADGVPIHVGDTIYDSAGNDVIVTSFSVHCEGFDIFVDGNSSHDHTPSHYTHERPDSWERIAYDIETVVPIDDEGDERLRHEFADRIRRLAERMSGDRGTHAQMTRRDRSDATTSAATPRTAPTGRQCSMRLI